MEIASAPEPVPQIGKSLGKMRNAGFDFEFELQQIKKTIEEDAPSMNEQELTRFTGTINRAISFTIRPTIHNHMEDIQTMDSFYADKLAELRDDQANFLNDAALFISLVTARGQRKVMKSPEVFQNLVAEKF